LKKKFQNGRFKKTEFFKMANSQKKIVKISWIGPWRAGLVGLIDAKSIDVAQPICS
jgi:hypothetical protein